jgi:DNA replication and repair protein RecF
VHRLIEGGPSERRRFIDWGVFHVEPTFVDQWRRFQRALRQRNAALAAGSPAATVRAWDPELIASGTALTEHRERYLAALSDAVAGAGQRLLAADVTLELRSGWPADLTLAQALDASWTQDQTYRRTHAGPHRAEVMVRLDGALARGRVSRGQQKLLASALMLGQLRHDSAQGSRVAALLVDDPAAELDPTSLGA